MEEPRSEAEAGRDALAVADQDADILQGVAMVLVAFDIGEERAIVAGSNSREMCREIFRQASRRSPNALLFLASAKSA